MTNEPDQGATKGSGLLHLIHAEREPIDGGKSAVRYVYKSEVARSGEAFTLDEYIAERAPLFYRSAEAVIRDIRDGNFRTAFSTTLSRLPTSKTFRESHFGEVVAGVFAEEVLGLPKIYSKLSLLTAENANPYKMDLLLYDPSSDPITFILGEVKSSPKSNPDSPAGHDQSCFADLFASMKKYSGSDAHFDLTAARDHMSDVPERDRERVRAALKPYSGAQVEYAGFVVIDQSTYDHDEAQVLRTRKSEKRFSVDMVCIESYSEVADNALKGIWETEG